MGEITNVERDLLDAAFKQLADEAKDRGDNIVFLKNIHEKHSLIWPDSLGYEKIDAVVFQGVVFCRAEDLEE